MTGKEMNGRVGRLASVSDVPRELESIEALVSELARRDLAGAPAGFEKRLARATGPMLRGIGDEPKRISDAPARVLAVISVRWGARIAAAVALLAAGGALWLAAGRGGGDGPSDGELFAWVDLLEVADAGRPFPGDEAIEALFADTDRFSTSLTGGLDESDLLFEEDSM